jgi:YVTN family beta-propeller protein
MMYTHSVHRFGLARHAAGTSIGLLAVLGLAAAVAGPLAAGTQPPPVQRYEQAGIAVEFSLQPLDSASRLKAGEDALATFRVADARTGRPLAGVRPRAWLSAQTLQATGNEKQCADKVRGFSGGQLGSRADVDLNGYYVLALNHDKTISVINPQVGFSLTKLESMIVLPGVGADWALSKDRNFLYVSVPDPGAIVVVDTRTRKTVATLPVAGAKPMRVALQPDGRYVWIGLDGAGRAAVIDTAANRLVREVGVGEGLHAFAFSADSRYAFVTNAASHSVSIIDTQTLTATATVRVGKTPVAAAYSALAQRVYVASLNAGVAVVDPVKGKIVARVPVLPGTVAIGFAEDGRYALAVNQMKSTVSVIDAATDRVTAAGAVVKDPDQVVFTRRYAYVRGIESEKFSLLDLNELRLGRFAPVDIQAGQRPASAEPKEIGVAAMIAPTPEGNAAMIANAPDRTIYYYAEGMMAPMGTFSNYKRMPHALMILDRSLTETAPGVYAAHVKLTKGGRFDVPVLIDQPRLVNCFQVTVAEQPGAKKAIGGAAVQVEAQFDEGEISPRKAIILKFKIIDSISKAHITGLSDARALVFEPPGVWQQRHSLKELGNGVYALDQSFPHAGLFNVMLEIPSQGLHYADLQPHSVRVTADGKKNTNPGKAEGTRK